MKTKFRFQSLISVILLLVSFFLLTTLTSCTNKSEQCEQVAFAMKKYGFVSNSQYHSGGMQNLCQHEWDTVCLEVNHGTCTFKDNAGWRDCILDARSKASMNKCGSPYIKGDKFQ